MSMPSTPMPADESLTLAAANAESVAPEDRGDATLAARHRPSQSAGQATTGPNPSESADPPNELIDHPKYRLIRLLGQGGMGIVWEAQHLHMDRRVALKVIRGQYTVDG